MVITCYKRCSKFTFCNNAKPIFIFSIILVNFNSCISFVNNAKCLQYDTHYTCKNHVLPSFPKVSHISPPLSTISIMNVTFTEDSSLRSKHLQGLTSLERLTLQHCGLRRLQPGVFSSPGLQKLTLLDLSSNKLSIIDDEIFANLTLDYLILDSNPGIIFKDNAFKGLSVSVLSLRKCKITSIFPELVQPLYHSLTNLNLEHNEIKNLHSNLDNLFENLKRFDLSGNPLQCSCSLKWLIKHVKRISNTDKLNNDDQSSKSEIAKCFWPNSNNALDVRDIDPVSLACQAPVITNIYITINANCTASIICDLMGHPIPTYAWYELKLPYDYNNDDAQSDNWNRILDNKILHLKVPNLSQLSKYKFKAMNEMGTVNATFQIKWPNLNSLSFTSPVLPYNHYPTATTLGKNILFTKFRTQNNIHEPQFDLINDYKNNHFFEKKFTLIEMLGAILGTFLCSLTFCLISLRFLTNAWHCNNKSVLQQNCYAQSYEYNIKKESKKQSACLRDVTTNVNTSSAPWWPSTALHNGCNQLYGSHHIYDVPRNDSAYIQSNTVDDTAERTGFLDFRTPQKQLILHNNK